MKLYATVSSERATKGQGGNKYIQILLTMLDKNNERKEFCTLFYGIDAETGDYFLAEQKGLQTNEMMRKGKQQKGEDDLRCPDCYAIDNTGNTDCPRHRK